MNDRELDLQIERLIRVYRVVGWIVLVAGGCALPFVVIHSLGTTGPTSSKFGSIGLAAFFPLFGALCVFPSKDNLASNLRRTLGFAIKLQSQRKK